jgi:cytochrome c
MTKTFSIVAVACAVLLAGCAARGGPSAAAATGPTGLYTEAQAMRGTTLYSEQCASCHGEDLTGIADLFPALAGDAFLMLWQGRPMSELFEKVSLTMPALDPGSLTPEQSADLVAYMLSVSKYPAGTTDLASSADALGAITIDAPQ